MRSPLARLPLYMGILLCSPQWAGAQWVRTGTLGGGWITALVPSDTNLFASTRQGGVFLSTNNGAKWAPVNSGLPAKTDIQCLAVSGGNIFAGTVERGLFVSRNHGASWTEADSGLPAGCSVWRLEASGSNLFAVAGGERAIVFRSTDSGASWAAAGTGLPRTEVLCLAVSGTNLFAGTASTSPEKDGGVFQSTDNGASWTGINSGLPQNTAILRLAVIDTSVFAGTDIGGRVLLLTYNAPSWKNVSAGLPNYIEFSLSDLAVSGTNLFLGSFRGVYSRARIDKAWKAINVGLPAGASVYCLAASGTDLFAGTEEGEVWRLPLSDAMIKKW